jgi:hypothetical protein
MKNYCKCGLHCKKYGMNAYYCRKQFLRNPTEYIPVQVITKIVPEEYKEIVCSIIGYKEEIGKLSAVVIMRKFKMTFEKAKEIMGYT